VNSQRWRRHWRGLLPVNIRHGIVFSGIAVSGEIVMGGEDL